MLKPLKRLACNPFVSIKLKASATIVNKKGQRASLRYSPEGWKNPEEKPLTRTNKWVEDIHPITQIPFSPLQIPENPTWLDHRPFQDRLRTPSFLFLWPILVNIFIAPSWLCLPLTTHTDYNQPLLLAPLLICLTIPPLLFYISSSFDLLVWNSLFEKHLLLLESV